MTYPNQYDIHFQGTLPKKLFSIPHYNVFARSFYYALSINDNTIAIFH